MNKIASFLLAVMMFFSFTVPIGSKVNKIVSDLLGVKNYCADMQIHTAKT